MSLKSDVEKWVNYKLDEEFDNNKIRAPKVIRDSCQDSYIFGEYEINVIDTPIVQRLRRIHQTSLAFLTYPSAHHNRFEHSLGVTIIADKIGNALYKKELNGGKVLVTPDLIKQLRLAAILHDVGHGPFSHASEEIYGKMGEMETIREEEDKFSDAKAHEILSNLIVTSKRFREFTEGLDERYGTKTDVDEIGDMIVGYMSAKEKYKSDVINGPFDADKIDYIKRDSYFTGLKMELDLVRIMHTMSISKGDRKEIVVELSGAPNLEQILFNKIHLYPSVYHHQKVRSLICMFKSIFEFIKDNNLDINGYNFKNPTDFLYIDDVSLLSANTGNHELDNRIRMIKNRYTLKRALVISQQFIVGLRDEKSQVDDEVKEEVRANYFRLAKDSEKPERMRELREMIVEKIESDCSVYDIWLDLPDPTPRIPEPSQCSIRITDEKYESLRSIFPIDNWLTTYSEIRWRGHVFCPHKSKIRSEVDAATREILRKEYNLELEKEATTFAKY